MAAHLGEVDFPPYVVKCVDETHFLVAGGGGQARTGVPNAIVSYAHHFPYFAVQVCENTM